VRNCGGSSQYNRSLVGMETARQEFKVSLDLSDGGVARHIENGVEALLCLVLPLQLRKGWWWWRSGGGAMVSGVVRHAMMVVLVWILDLEK
jgi:hypothetical protein